MILIAALLTAALIYQDHTYDQRTNLYDKCVSQQIELYGDLCAEGRSCEENSKDCNVIDAHFEGVKCAIEAIQMCKE